MSETAATASSKSADPGSEADRNPKGISFPTMSLGKVVEIIHKVGGNGADFSMTTFAQYCGHETANSGPFRTKLAAFRDWSMVTTKDARVLLTTLGKDVARAEDPLADQALLLRAFDSCKIFKGFYDDQAKDVPLKREVLGRGAVFDLKVAPKSQERFVTALVDSAVTAGLATIDAESATVTFKAGGAVAEGRPEAAEDPREIGEVQTETPGTTPSTQRPPTTTSAPVLLRQVWPTVTGEIVLTIHSREPLPASVFSLVGNIVQAAEDLAASIALPAPTADDAA
jgi:hypothetical protein